MMSFPARAAVPFPLLLLMKSTFVAAVSATAAILPAERATLWNPGLNSVGGISSAAWPIHSTLSPSGQDDTLAINNALAAVGVAASAASPKVVRLNGRFSSRGGCPGGRCARSWSTASPPAYRLTRDRPQPKQELYVGRIEQILARFNRCCSRMRQTNRGRLEG